MWEISENLHRNDLDRLQRALHEAEWIKLWSEGDGNKPPQLGEVLKGGRGNVGGIMQAARELPVKGDTEEARRANLRRDTDMSGSANRINWVKLTQF